MDRAGRTGSSPECPILRARSAVRRCRGADPGTRHRREHGGLHADQQQRAAAAAGGGAFPSGTALPRRSDGRVVGEPGVARGRTAIRRCVRRGVRLGPDHVRHRGIGGEPVHRGSVGERPAVRDARGAAGARPRFHHCRRSARVRGGRRGDGDQPPVLARAPRRRRGRHRSAAVAQRRSFHGDRGHAAGVLRADGRPDVRCGGSAGVRGGGARQPVAAGPAGASLAQCHGASGSGAVARRGDGDDAGVATGNSGSDAAGGDGCGRARALAERPVHAVAGRDRRRIGAVAEPSDVTAGVAGDCGPAARRDLRQRSRAGSCRVVAGMRWA